MAIQLFYNINVVYKRDYYPHWLLDPVHDIDLDRAKYEITFSALNIIVCIL